MRASPISASLRAGVRTQLFSAASMVALAAGFCQSAQAQDAGIETVTVTSSRVQREGYSAPTPVTSVSTKDIEQETPSTLGDVLANLPSFRATNTPTTAGVGSLNGGQVTADLRGLGSSRTLVLVDGKRFVPNSSGGTVDLTQIPTLLVQRVEVVTGGASAAYGSDAVSGVVNFILKDRIDGLQGQFQYGESQYGDMIEEQGALAYGMSLLSDKLTFTIGANYINNEGMGSQYTRPWGRQEYGILTNTSFATNGLPNFIIAPNVHTSTITTGGIITAGPLKGLAFSPDGTAHSFQYGTVYGSSMVGGEEVGPNPTLGTLIGKPYTALTSLAHIQYEVTPEIKAFFDVSAARTTAGGASQQARDTALTIFSDNAYLPASVKAAMATSKVTSFTLGRYYDDTGLISLHSTDTTQRYIAGLEGKLWDSWTWDANLQFGQNRYFLDFGPNNRKQANFLLAADAVVGSNGAITCRSTLTNPTNGCIPVDVLGGVEQLNSFVNGTATYHLVTEQEVADLDLQGEPFSTWAGPVSVAGGMEYRRESARAIPDAVSTQVNSDGSTGGWALGNQVAFHGGYFIYEGYVETVVPVLAADTGIPLLHDVDINAALRLTSYSSAGGVTTWKGGFNWSPLDDLRVRGTRSHDVRAPNLSELFQGGTGSSYTSAFDKVLNQSVQVRQVSSGNLALKPEAAETWTGGIVYQPSWLSGFAASVDYYNIKVNKVIGSIPVATIVTGCNAGNTLYCQSVVFNANGTLNYIIGKPLNLNYQKTSGVDMEMSYSLPLSDISEELPGNFSAHALTTFVDHLITSPVGSAPYDTAGQVSNFNKITGVPHWLGNYTATYDLDPYSAYLRMRYIGAGHFAYSLRTGTGAANTVNNNDVSDFFYFDVGGSRNVDVLGQKAQFFFSVDDLFNKAPPALPAAAAGSTYESSTNTVYYDPVGRLFKVGFRFNT